MQTPVVWHIPENITFEEAAVIGGIPADTAVQALYTRLDIPCPWEPSRKTIVVADISILVWSGAALVSYYAIQLAKLAGLKVYTTASAHHHEALTRLGADTVFDYRDTDMAQKIKTALGGAIHEALNWISKFGSTALVAKALSDEGRKIVMLRRRPAGNTLQMWRFCLPSSTLSWRRRTKSTVWTSPHGALPHIFSVSLD